MRRRVLGFAVLPMLSLLTPFLLLPLIARAGGEGGWLALNLGQTIGALGAVVGGLGWALSGPSAVAMADLSERQVIYAASMSSRGPVSLSAAIVCSGLCALLVDISEWPTAILMSTAIVASALSPTWYSIGAGSVRSIAIYETLPRLVVTLVSAGLIVLGSPVWIYPILLLVVTLGGIVLFSARVARVSLRQVTSRNFLRDMVDMRASTATVITSASYALAPLPLATIFASPTTAAVFGSADRLFRLALTIVQVSVNATQNWVTQSRGGRIVLDARRAGLAVGIASLIGLGGLIGFGLFGQQISAWLFSQSLAADSTVLLFYGLAVLGIAISSALSRLILIPLGHVRDVFVSTILGAATGLSAMATLGALFGAVGVALGFALSELVVASYQIIRCALVLVKRKRSGH